MRPLTLRVLALALGVGGCTKAKTPETVAPTPAVATTGPLAPAGTEVARAPVERVHFEANIDGLEDMLKAGERVLAQVSPERPVDLHAVVRSIAAQRGLASGFVDALDLEGRIGLSVGLPRAGQDHARPDDIELSASLPTRNSTRALEAMSERFAPQPLGGGVWESARPDEFSFLVRPTASALEFGRTRAELDGAPSLVAAPIPEGKRLLVRGTDLSQGDVDPGAMLAFAGPFAGHLSTAMQRATEFTLSGDLGMSRDLALGLDVRADLHDLGLAPLGPSLTRPSALTLALPPNPVAVVVLSWGDPTLVHRELDRMVATVPEPFDAWLDDLVKGAHAVLDVVSHEVALGLYLDANERATFLVAGSVKDDAAGRSALRSVLDATRGLAEQYRTMSGDDPEYRFTLEYRPDGATLSGTSADVFSATVPAAFEADANRLQMVFGAKPRLQAYSMVAGGLGVLAIGAGARDLASEFAANRRSQGASAEDGPGLPLARTVAGGCGLCISLDAKALLRGWTIHARDFRADAKATERLRAVQALPDGGTLVVGARGDANGGGIGIGASQRLLFGAGSSSIIRSVIAELELMMMAPQP